MKLPVVLVLLSVLAAPQDPALSTERLLLRTSAGDMVFALYPEAAPRTTAQILKLARLGVFDGLRFSRLEPDFVVQLDDHRSRPVPLTPEQAAAIVKIPLEGKTVKHRRGVLSMARPDDDPDGADTSFSILLGRGDRVAHLDGAYTPFGHLVHGEEVLAEIEKVRLEGNQPSIPILLLAAEVVSSEEELKGRPLKGPVSLQRPVPNQPWLVLRTTMGDMLFRLDPAVAPKSVDQIVRVVQMGILDGTKFILVRRDLIQAEGHVGRWDSLSHAQRESIRKLPLEPGGRHVRGSLHLVRAEGDGHGGETSFCVFLEPVPSFDGRYTVFGRLEKGYDVLSAISRVDTLNGTPLQPLVINQALILEGDVAADFQLNGPPSPAPVAETPKIVFWFVGFMMIVGAAIFVLAGRLTPKLVGALGLLVVLIGFFLLYVQLVPQAAAKRSPWLAVAIFCGSVALFKLMNRFESPRN